MAAAVPTDSSEGLVVVLLVTLLLGPGSICILFAVRWWRDRRNIQRRLFHSRFVSPATRHARSLLFERPGRWLAIKANSVAEVRGALGLDETTPCSWDEGLTEAREQMLFVAPPVDGWVLVVGHSLPDPADDPDRSFHVLRRLSDRIGHVQFFSVNRIVNHHAWAIVDQGEVFRAYAWAGEVMWTQGPLTAAERELQMRVRPYASEAEHPLSSDEAGANCDRLTRLAARWGIDPAMVAEEVSGSDGGFVGRIGRRI